MKHADPEPHDRMIRLGDALEEFYREQMAKAGRESQRLTDPEEPTDG